MTEPVPDPLSDALRLRASDADRERVAGLLRDAFAEGRLSPVEHEERLAEVYRATTYAELLPVLHDLPVPPGVLSVPGAGQAVAITGAQPPAVPSSSGVVVDPSRAGQAQGAAVAILSGVERKGAWVVPSSLSAVSVLGGVELDLTDAVLTSQTTTITAFCVLGSVEITVPEGIDVQVDAVAILGGQSGPGTAPPPGAPTLRITGLVLLGGIEVKRPKDGGRRALRRGES